MSRGKSLSPTERKKIIDMHIDGINNTEIARRLKRDRHFVKKVIDANHPDISVLKRIKDNQEFKTNFPPLLSINVPNRPNGEEKTYTYSSGAKGGLNR